MTDPQDPDLRHLDDAAQRAARGLRDHVLQRVDADRALALVPASSPRVQRGRFLAAAAAAVVLLGSVVVLSDHRAGDERSRLEVDEDGNKLPAPQPGTLTALGPRDGKDSIQLPLTAVPSTGLHDRDTVTVSASGFLPGESVGLVQCAQEAGGETREQRGGIDACDISPYTSITATSDGEATGDYQVQRFLTTPLTGTVDCAVEANRCLLAMGALSDYDRSGGFGIAFAPPTAGDPPGPEIPTLVVTPAAGLADGDMVHVEGSGYQPGTQMGVQVCSTDPSACWDTGEKLDTSSDADEGCADGCDSFSSYGLEVDDAGNVEGDVPVWRFLPGQEPGTYVDCSVSECSLRASTDGETAAAPFPLGFVGGGAGPVPPAVAVDPDHDLSPGDTVVVRGAGFAPGLSFGVSLCLAPASDPTTVFACLGGAYDPNGLGESDLPVEDDGTFAVEFTIPDPDTAALFEDGTAITATCDGGGCLPGSSDHLSCEGDQFVCTIRVDNNQVGLSLRPVFPPAPVTVTFGRAR